MLVQHIDIKVDKDMVKTVHESPDFLKTVLNEVKRCTSMVNQRIAAIQAEMEKGEKADYSQFKGEKAQSDQLSQEETHEAHQEAAKQIEEEHRPSRRR